MSKRYIKVKEFKKEAVDEYKIDYIKVKVYFNGLYEVIPSPFDKSACSGVEKSYGLGMFISWKIMYLPKKFFSVSSNFNM